MKMRCRTVNCINENLVCRTDARTHRPLDFAKFYDVTSRLKVFMCIGFFLFEWTQETTSRLVEIIVRVLNVTRKVWWC